MKSIIFRIYNQISDFMGLRRRIKAWYGLRYWKICKAKEGILSNSHYEYFYTTHFGLDKEFYNGKKILDLGCGPRGSLEWADMASERIGLDPLADAYSKLGTNYHKMKYVAAPAEQIPFPDEYFDVVSSFNSLDHVDNLDKTLNEIIRVIAPGGLFLLLTDLNHDPSFTEPIVFSWDITKKFLPHLKVVQEKHYERSPVGIYKSILAGIPYDYTNKLRRYGVLSAKFIKIV